MDREFDIKELLRQMLGEEEEQAEMSYAAKQTRLIYESFVNTGFTEDQALKITIGLLIGIMEKGK